MALSNQQIERYSRQIIVPGIGGIGQERLLAAHIAVAGDAVDVEAVLAYLIGAGAGRISLRVTDNDENRDSLLTRIRDLNRDVVVDCAKASEHLACVLAIVGSAAALESIRMLVAGLSSSPMIFARLDSPSRIAIMPQAPPCLVCADANLQKPFLQKADGAGFVSMLATTETIKLIVQEPRTRKPSLIELDGYSSSSRELHVRSDMAACACSSHAARKEP